MRTEEHFCIVNGIKNCLQAKITTVSLKARAWYSVDRVTIVVVTVVAIEVLPPDVCFQVLGVGSVRGKHEEDKHHADQQPGKEVYWVLPRGLL